MAIPDINLGGSPNDGNGTSLRSGGAIVNQILDMFNTVTGGIAYAGGVVGIGTILPTNPLHAFSSSSGVAPLLVENTHATGVGALVKAGTAASSYIGDFRLADNTSLFKILGDGGLIATNLKSGATQGAAGAAANEFWVTSGHATLPDNVTLRGV